jgi:hypothetical protein
MTAIAAVSPLTASWLSQSPQPAVLTRAAIGNSYRDSGYWETVRRSWNDVIDHSLIPWANGHLEIDDDLLPPTAASIQTAAILACAFRDAGGTPPTDVLPNGDGGVLFENRVGRASTQIEVLGDGSAEFSRYDDDGFVDAILLPASDFTQK